ncbi:MAG TPA: M50 family metallopeptidase [Gemmataceae bacterium]|jgi:hypothetical protein|nr:M50 family metallopeptidase [Gemmataceae bacterium]
MLLLLFFLASFVSAIVVHEMGHAIGVRLAQLSFVAMDLVFLRVQRKESGVGFRVVPFKVERNRPPAAVWFIATNATRRQIAVAIGSGPIANFALGAALLAVSAAISSGRHGFAIVSTRTSVPSWINLPAILNLSIGVANLLPVRFSGFPSDGKQLLDLALGTWSPAGLPASLARTFVSSKSFRVHLSQPIRYEFEAPDEVAIVEFPPSTCRPPDAPIS